VSLDNAFVLIDGAPLQLQIHGAVESELAKGADSVDEFVRGAYDARQALPWIHISGNIAKEGVMMHILMIISLAAVSMAGVAEVAISRASADSEEATLRTLVPKVISSWESLDITKVEPYYAADANLAYFDIVPLKYNNWAEYRTGVQKALFEPNRSIKLRLNDDLGVHRRGSLAWATVTFGADLVSKEGAATHLDGRWTMVLEKRAHGWIVVHEHVSAPLGGS
jgi:ketosteroid isomerase-like protein